MIDGNPLAAIFGASGRPRTLRATMLVEQEWITRPLRAYGTCTAVMSKGVLEVTVHRRADPASRKAPAARAQ
jgi:hypothetical protein